MFSRMRLPAAGLAFRNTSRRSKADPGRDGIGLDFQRASVTGSSGRPVTHKKVIVAGEVSDVGIARVEGESAFVAGHRFAPASLPPIDATDVIVDFGIIGRSRRGDLELLKSCVVLFLPNRGKDLKPYGLRPRWAISVELPPPGRALSPSAQRIGRNLRSRS